MTAPDATTLLRIADLVDDDRIRVRGIDGATVARYAEVPADAFPPIVTIGGYVADGWHRIEAARVRGEDTIRADVRDGTVEDAIAFAALANEQHGKPPTREERNTAIRHLAGIGWSQRRIAKQINVSAMTVNYAINGRPRTHVYTPANAALFGEVLDTAMGRLRALLRLGRDRAFWQAVYDQSTDDELRAYDIEFGIMPAHLREKFGEARRVWAHDGTDVRPN